MKRNKILVVLGLLSLIVLITGCSYTLPWMEAENDKPEIPIIDSSSSEQNKPPIEESEQTVAPQQEMRLTVLYVMDSGMQGLVHYPVEIPKVVGIARSAILHMVDNYANEPLIDNTNLRLPLPNGTEVLGATVKEDGLCKIDFTDAILECDNAAHEKLAVDAIVYTLTEFQTIDHVQIMVEGEIMDTLTYGTAISKPLRREE